MNIYKYDLKEPKIMDYSINLSSNCYILVGDICTKNKFITDTNDMFYNLSIAVPGLTREEIGVRVDGDTVFVYIPESKFTELETFERKVVFPFTKKDISATLEDGVFDLSIAKPESYGYSIKIK